MADNVTWKYQNGRWTYKGVPASGVTVSGGREQVAYQRAMSQVAAYKSGAGYDLIKAVEAGISPDVLKQAGFKDEDIERAWNLRTPQLRESAAYREYYQAMSDPKKLAEQLGLRPTERVVAFNLIEGKAYVNDSASPVGGFTTGISRVVDMPKAMVDFYRGQSGAPRETLPEAGQAQISSRDLAMEWGGPIPLEAIPPRIPEPLDKGQAIEPSMEGQEAGYGGLGYAPPVEQTWREDIGLNPESDIYKARQEISRFYDQKTGGYNIVAAKQAGISDETLVAAGISEAQVNKAGAESIGISDILRRQEVALAQFQKTPEGYLVWDFVVANPTQQTIQTLKDANFQNADALIVAAQKYVAAYQEAERQLSESSREVQVYVVGSTFGFTKRQEAANSETPLAVLSSEEKRQVVEKFTELNKPLKEIREQAYADLRQKWIEAAPIVVLSVAGGVGGAAAGVVGTIGRAAYVVGGLGYAGYGYYDTAKNLDKLTQRQAIFSFSLDTIMAVGSLAGVRGIRSGPIAMRASETIGKLAESKSLTVRIGEGISTVKSALTPEAVRFYLQRYGYKTDPALVEAYVRELGWKTDPQIVRQQLTETVTKLRDGVTNAIQTSPEVIRYYVRDLGLKTDPQALRDYMVKVGWRTDPQLVAEDLRILRDAAMRKLSATPDAIRYAIQDIGWKTDPEIIASYIRNVGLKTDPQEVFEAVRRLGQRWGSDLASLVESAPDRIRYAITELGLKTDPDVVMRYLWHIGLKTDPQLLAQDIKAAGHVAMARMVADAKALRQAIIDLGIKTDPSVLKDYIETIGWKTDPALLARDIRAMRAAIQAKITSAPDAIRYYIQEIGWKTDPEVVFAALRETDPALLSTRLRRVVNEIYEAMKAKDKAILLERAAELERLSAELDDKTLGSLLQVRARDIQRRPDEYLKPAPETPEELTNAAKAMDLADDTIRQAYDDLLRDTKTLGLADLSRPVEERPGQIKGTREYRAFEVQPSEGAMPIKPTNPEQVRLIDQISKDNARLFDLYNRGGEPYEIEQTVIRVNENMAKLAELRGQANPFGSFMEALDQRLRELGYSLQDIASFTDRQKLEIVSKQIPPSQSGVRNVPPEPKSTESGGGVAVQERVETKPVTEIPEAGAKTQTEAPIAKPETKPWWEAGETRPATEVVPAITETVGAPYWALVWENGHIFVRLITPAAIPKGYVRVETRTGELLVPAEEYGRMTPEQIERLYRQPENESIFYSPFPFLRPEGRRQPEETKSEVKQPTPEWARPIDGFTWPEAKPEEVRLPTEFRQPEEVIKPKLAFLQPFAPVEEVTTTKRETRVFPPSLPRTEVPEEWLREGVPKGTLEWRQGVKWVVLPPPYNDEDKLYLDEPLPGTYKFAVGKGSARETLQVLGGSPEKDAVIDMGWATVKVNTKGKDLEIEFLGGQEAANARWGAEREAMADLDKESYVGPRERVIERIKSQPIRISHADLEAYQRQRVIEEMVEDELTQYIRPTKTAQPSTRPKERQQQPALLIPNRYYLGRKLRPPSLE